MLLRQEHSTRVTTLVDYYGLGGGFPGDEGGPSQAYRRVAHLEERNAADIAAERPERFLPYIQLHEFEALLFTDPEKLASRLNAAPEPFQRIRNIFDTPEDIDDSPDRAPSKRIANLASYSKVRQGPLIAEAIGIDAIRAACPRFRAWTDKIADWSSQIP
jgi:hypothetical protein